MSQKPPKSFIQWLAPVHSFGILFTLFTLRPRPPTLSVLPKSILFPWWAAVFAQTPHPEWLSFTAELPFSIYVVLRDSSAGRALRFLIFVSREWPVTELVNICHTQVQIVICQLVGRAFTFILEDCIVLASICYDIRIARVPTFTAFGTSISA